MATLRNISSSPHFRSKTDTQSLMLDVILAMIPITAFSVYHFGIRALLILFVTVLSAVSSEYLWEKFMKKPITVTDLSAVVTGMILALNMPPEIPLWIPMFGAAFAIIVVKQLYGGIGQNFMNPALAARCFLLISFASVMNDFSSAKIGFDAVSSATPLAAAKAGDLTSYSLMQLFMGTIPGTLGEGSSLAIIIGGIYLVVCKVISPRIPLTYLGSFAVFAFIFGQHDFSYVLYELMSGGILFGAFFMATDYVTSPLTRKGQLIYGIVLGVLTGVLRLFGASAEGTSYAIIISNLLVPLIERYTLPTAFGLAGKRGK